MTHRWVFAVGITAFIGASTSAVAAGAAGNDHPEAHVAAPAPRQTKAAAPSVAPTTRSPIVIQHGSGAVRGGTVVIRPPAAGASAPTATYVDEGDDASACCYRVFLANPNTVPVEIDADVAIDDTTSDPADSDAAPAPDDSWREVPLSSVDFSIFD